MTNELDKFRMDGRVAIVTGGAGLLGAGVCRGPRDEHGRLDLLVNSAALDPKFDATHHEQAANAFEDYPLDLWNQALSVNLTGMFLCSQAVSRPLLEQGRG